MSPSALQPDSTATSTRRPTGVPDSTFGDGVHCPNCSYHLRGIPEAACPECGFAYDHRGVRYVARRAAYDEDAAARRAIRWGAFACVCFVGGAFAGRWPSVIVEFLCIGLVCVCAVGLFWYYRDLAPPSPWRLLWKLISFLGCVDVAALLVAAPSLGRWLGVPLCGLAWASLLALRSNYPEALSAIDADVRQCVQFRSVFALGMVGLSSCLGILAWV